MRRCFSLLLLALLGCLVACGTSGTEQAAPRGDDSSPPSASEKSVAKIVAFGDSLTAGYGLPPSKSYPALLQEKLNDDGYDYEVVNAGVSGDTSAGGLRRIDWSLDGDVSIVILELGANDILRGQPIEATGSNLSRIIERIRARGARVLLAGMEAPTNSGPVYRESVRRLFSDLADQHEVELIPFFLEGVGGVGSLNQRDGIHPNEEGTRKVAETVYRYLKPMLDER